ncbi:hypothetical protein [Actinoplanes sp. NPDC051411]|uniref:SCO7613 C-terminal domain-containing membrane protein n=1 Tax=Actinoplanes sp. NPDC051411 TaxID=3155522 RepID=UPI003422FBF2
MTYPCPFCGAAASSEAGCPACGRGPDRLALEVVRLDGVIAELTTRLTAARLTAQRLDGELKQTWVRRAAAAAEVRAEVAQAQSPAVTGLPLGATPPRADASRSHDPNAPQPRGAEPGPHGRSTPRPRRDASRVDGGASPARADASTKWIQNSLFLLGGLLLAVAAIVFTAVAWAQFGVGGRAAVLAAFTGAALAVPPPAVRRGLAATAETFAAIGLLLILLDGYAAWYVNLLDVTRLSPWSYAALVVAATALTALAFPRLTGPRFAALLLAQPVLPLLLVPAGFAAAGHAYTYAGVLALDLTVLVLARGPLRIMGGLLAGAALLPTGALALTALLSAETLGRATVAGAALLLTAALPLTALAFLAPQLKGPADRSAATPDAASVLRVARAIFAALMVVEVAVIAVRMAVLVAPGQVFLADSLALLGVAILAATVRSVWLDRVVGRGVQIGAGIALFPFAVAALGAGVSDAVDTLDTARPPLNATLTTLVPAADPSLLPALASLAAAVAVTVPSAWRRLTVLSAGTLTVLAVPAALHLPWWTAPILDLAATAAALFPATRYRAPSLAAFWAPPASPPPASAESAVGMPASPAPASAANAPAVPSATPAAPFTYSSELVAALLLTAHGVTAAFGNAAVAAATLTALAALAVAVTLLTRRGPRRIELAGPGVFVSLLTLPAIAWATTAALTSSPLWPPRIALAAALLPPLALRLRGRRLGDLRPFALAAALLPITVAPTWAVPAGDSVGIYAGVALLTLSFLAADRAGWFAAFLPAAALVTATAEPVWRLLFVKQTPDVPASAAIAVLLATAATPRVIKRATGLLALTAALALAAAGVPWPCLPAAELLLGLAGLVAAALRAPTPYGIPVISLLLAGAGLAGTTPSRPVLTAAEGAVLIAAAVVGVAGRTRTARVIGWLCAVAAGIGVVHNVAPGDDAFPVLGVAAGTLALSWLLHRTARHLESRAVEAAAHATAALSLLLTLGGERTAPAVVWFVWGAALAVRALRRDRRDAYLVAAGSAELAGWCWLMVVHHVGLVEAYSVPAAAVALLAGVLARRRQRELTSWAAYGPALAAGLLPSLASIAGSDGQYPRRLLLGLAGLAILLAGARVRLQAPVVVGGGALALVALHELAQVWDLVPRWIPLAAAGLLLVALAATLERRRRDFDRLRTALTRMS